MNDGTSRYQLRNRAISLDEAISNTPRARPLDQLPIRPSWLEDRLEEIQENLNQNELNEIADLIPANIVNSNNSINSNQSITIDMAIPIDTICELISKCKDGSKDLAMFIGTCEMLHHQITNKRKRNRQTEENSYIKRQKTHERW